MKKQKSYWTAEIKGECPHLICSTVNISFGEGDTVRALVCIKCGNIMVCVQMPELNGCCVEIEGIER